MISNQVPFKNLILERQGMYTFMFHNSRFMSISWIKPTVSLMYCDPPSACHFEKKEETDI